MCGRFSSCAREVSVSLFYTPTWYGTYEYSTYLYSCNVGIICILVCHNTACKEFFCVSVASICELVKLRWLEFKDVVSFSCFISKGRPVSPETHSFHSAISAAIIIPSTTLCFIFNSPYRNPFWLQCFQSTKPQSLDLPLRELCTLLSHMTVLDLSSLKLC